MKRFVIENMSCIKQLHGVIHDGRFRYLETFKTDSCHGDYRKYYEKGDHFDTLEAAKSDLNARRNAEIAKLQKRIDELSTEETVKVLDKEQSLHYANCYLKKERNFSYTVEV